MNRTMLRCKAWLMKIIAYLCGLRYRGYDPGFEETVKALDTPWKITCWLQANMTYEHDRVDYWNNPVETYRKRRGDCDDYARFAVHCLNRHGYPALFLVMYDKKTGHATAIYHTPDGMCTIGTWGLVKHKKHSIATVTCFFYGRPVCWLTYDEDLNLIRSPYTHLMGDI